MPFLGRGHHVEGQQPGLQGQSGAFHDRPCPHAEVLLAAATLEAHGVVHPVNVGAATVGQTT